MPISLSISHKLSLPENYFCDKNSRLIIENESISEINRKANISANISKLELRKSEFGWPQTDSRPKTKNSSHDKLELEDWLDQIL